MRKIVFVIIFCFIISYCKAQIDTINKNTMEYFDKNKYKNWEIDPDYYPITGAKFLKKGDERVSIHFSNENIIEVKSNYQSPIKTKNIYYPSNKLLWSSKKTFYNCIIGIVIEYNEIGKAIKKTNYDKEYAFTIDELCDFIQDEYNVNIRRISDRYIKWNVKKIYEPTLKKSCYRVDFYAPKPQVGEIYARKEIYIDSKTGKVLYEEDSFLFLEGGDLLPKSKTDFPKKDEINNNSTSIFIEETIQPKELGVPYKQGGYYPPDTYRLYDGRAYNREEWALYVKSRPWWERLFLS